MKASCSSCGKPFLFDDAKFGDRSSVRVRCPSCKVVVALSRPIAPLAAPPRVPAPSPAPADSDVDTASNPMTGPQGGAPTQKLKRDQVIADLEGGEVILPMPRGRRVALAILTGTMSGQVVPCGKSRMLLGRAGADVNVEDEEVSRRHAVLEIRDDRYFIKDLGSTNGTFVDERKITEAEIFDRGEFRVGGTQIMLIVTPDEDV